MNIKQLSRSTIQCYLLTIFLGLGYGWYMHDGIGCILDYIPRNFSSEEVYRVKVYLESKPGYYYTDSLTNIKTGEVLPVRYEKMQTPFLHLGVPPLPLWARATGLLCGLLFSVCVVFVLKWASLFLKNIRARQVFTFGNVRLLRRLSLVLGAVWLCNYLFACFDYWSISSLVDFEGYRPEFHYASSLSYLVLPALVLLVAEIFSIGLSLKEEQDLTI